MAIKLTKQAVEGLRAPDPSGKQRLVWDQGLKGFGVLVSGVSSAKTYIAQRKLPDGRTRRITVGPVAEISLDKARTEAAELLHQMRTSDPKAERRKRAAGTLHAVFDDYLKSNKMLTERTRSEYRKLIEGHLKDWLDTPLADVTPEMVEAKHAAIAAEIARRRGESRSGGGPNTGHATSNATFRAFRSLYNFAAERDAAMPPNPCHRLKRAWFAETRRETLVKADDMPKFWRALGQVENQIAADCVKLALLTGLRNREARGLKWSEIDFAGRLIRVPAKRMKGGRRQLDLPMSSQVRDVIVARRQLGVEGEFVFPADSKSGHVEDLRVALDPVAEMCGVRVTLHDLRRTFITVAEACDINFAALKALVSHSLGSDVTSGYIVMSTERLREPAQKVGDELARLCGIALPEGENVQRVG
jgi:integrase